MLGNFLGTLIFAALMVGVPTYVHWVRGGKRFPIRRSYRRITQCYMMGVGTLICAVATVLLGCTLYDWLWQAGWGYPPWAVPILLIIMAVAAGVVWLIRSWRRSGLDDFL